VAVDRPDHQRSTLQDIGIVTLAARKRRYLEMAVDMALSSRVHNNLPVALAADAEIADLANTDYPGVFDVISVIPERFMVHRAIKYGVVEACPFRQAMFIDADCWVLGSLEPTWSQLGDRVILFQGEVIDRDTDLVHHGFSTRRLMARFELDRYLKCNSGVFLFNRDAALPVMNDALVCYRDEVLAKLRGGFLGDEIAIAVVGGRRDLGVFALPWPMAWGDDLAVLDPANPGHPVCHLLAPIAKPALKYLMQDSVRRRRDNGVTDVGSEHWMWKQRRVARGAILEKLVRPFLPVVRWVGGRAKQHW
jgi:hypothetical protein